MLPAQQLSLSPVQLPVAPPIVIRAMASLRVIALVPPNPLPLMGSLVQAPPFLRIAALALLFPDLLQEAGATSLKEVQPLFAAISTSIRRSTSVMAPNNLALKAPAAQNALRFIATPTLSPGSPAQLLSELWIQASFVETNPATR